jgi:hypothetical protein
MQNNTSQLLFLVQGLGLVNPVTDVLILRNATYRTGRCANGERCQDHVFKAVIFAKMGRRDYERTLSDHPATSVVPNGIGWKYDPEDTLELNRFECNCEGRRPTKEELLIPPSIGRKRFLRLVSLTKTSW